MDLVQQKLAVLRTKLDGFVPLQQAEVREFLFGFFILFFRRMLYVYISHCTD